jgi:hypothetical protein
MAGAKGRGDTRTRNKVNVGEKEGEWVNGFKRQWE